MQKQLDLTKRELLIRNYSSKTIKSYLHGLKAYFVLKKTKFDILNIEIPNNLYGRNIFRPNEIQVFDISGRVVYTSQMTGSHYQLNITNLSDGSYTLKVGELRARFVK